jgi:glycosyltransferase involved in cell wall biosynthesis
MRVLYIIYWGATEAIGLAGTVPTLERLARDHGEDVILFSFDKPEDTRNASLAEAVRARLARLGIQWKDLGYTKRPPNLSTAYDIARGYAHASWLVVRHGVRVVHARTYVGGIIGALVRSTFPAVKMVCHLDGFWPDERVDDGIWREGSRAHRVARGVESWMYRRADAIIVLSERSRDVLRNDPRLAKKPILVVQTSCDVSRFEVRVARRPDEPLAVVYLGSLGGRRMTREVFRFFAIARSRGLKCTVATQTPLGLLRDALTEAGLTPEGLSMRAVAPSEVPALLAEHHAGLFLLRPGLSNIATSATKIGEYLASGMPVLLNDACGDGHDIVESTATGVVLRETTDASFHRAIDALEALTLDPATPARCREVAETTMGVTHCAAEQARAHRLVGNAPVA